MNEKVPINIQLDLTHDVSSLLYNWRERERGKEEEREWKSGGKERGNE